MRPTKESKTEKALRERQQAIVFRQNTLERISVSLRVMESVFQDAKMLQRSSRFCDIKRRAAANARLARKEWQKLWVAKFVEERNIQQLQTEIKYYENKLQKAKEYNERRRKRRAEKKQVRE